MSVDGRPIRVRQRTPATRAVALLTALAVATVPLAAPLPAQAQSLPRGIPLIRDAEIEQLMRDYTQPILRAAGLAQQNIQVTLINDRAFNAFVMDGRRIFVNAGALMDSKTPNEIIGVLAHETGHIAGGHLSKLRQQLAVAQTQSIIAMLLGIGAVVAAGPNSGNAAAAIMGPQEAIRRSLLSYQRQQEEAADRAGVKFLAATGQSAKGMHDTFKRMSDEILFAARNADPYMQSHPMPAERVRALEELARVSPHWDRKDSPELQLRHDLMRAKLSGYLDKPATVFNRYPPSDQTLPARYARALARFFQGGPGALEEALAGFDDLIASRPGYAYFWEAKGDLLMRSGKTREAIPSLRQALKLDPTSSLIRVQLAGALQEDQSATGLTESVGLLRKALIDDDNSRAYRLLANSYYKQGKRPEADAMIAQAYFMEGDVKQAQLFAKRAQTKLPSGTPEWLKNDDIINYKPQT
jgi:predicted Zn-dependent protease